MTTYTVVSEKRELGWVAWVGGFPESMVCKKTEDEAQRHAVQKALIAVATQVLLKESPVELAISFQEAK